MEEYWNPMVPELSVSNFEESLNFYQNLLGFKIRNQRSNPEFAYLENEKVQIMLEQIHDTGWATGELEYPLGRGVNFQIELTDISPILERLNAANVVLYREPNDSWYDEGNVFSGQREFLVQDPDGYLLRFTQYLGEKSK
ncbi:bleomycin resistance protein [Vibrio hepatarius]|uniref:bleomycin resistance protein n=1 Tax=Vibrio hepatarius TaxID=171383 RepID=UPI00148CEBFB|nr:VOC family protein [Vibrio hepatarius]NOI16484.1 VOC family protein [Vibrio hepatarius]